MISEKTKVKLKGASKTDKKMVRAILIAHYVKLVDEMISKGDYCSTTAYWKDFTPATHTMDIKKFIAKFKKYLKD